MKNRLIALWHYMTTRSGRTIAKLEAENAELRECLADRVVNETLVTGLVMESGITMGLKGGAAQLLGEMLAAQIEETGAINYLELNFTSRTIAPNERYVVTIQKCSGRTPHQLRLVAEAELARLRASLAVSPC